MTERIAVRVKNGRLKSAPFNVTTVYFHLDFESSSQFLIEVPANNDSHTFRYKKIKVHLLNGEYIVQSDGLKVVFFNADPIYNALLQKSVDITGTKGPGKPMGSTQNPRSSFESSRTLTKASPVIQSTKPKPVEPTKPKVTADVGRGLTPEKSRTAIATSKVISSPVVTAAPSRQIGYESPFKLRSPDMSAKLTPNTAEKKRQQAQPQPLFPSYVIGQAGTTPLRGSSLYDTTTTTSEAEVDPFTIDVGAYGAEDNVNNVDTAAAPGAITISRDLTPVKLRDQRTLTSLPGLYSRNPTVGAFTDVDIFSPNPGALKQYGNKRKALLPSAAAYVPSRYASPNKALSASAVDAEDGPVTKKAAIIPRAAESKSFWDSKPLHTAEGRGVSFMSALNSGSGLGSHHVSAEGEEEEGEYIDRPVHAPAAPVQKNKLSRYFQTGSAPATSTAATRASGGGLLEEFLSVNASEDSTVTELDQFGSSSADQAALKNKLRGGIRNLGNTCYMSATLQALMSSEVLMKELESQFWSNLPSFLKLQQQQQVQQQDTATSDEPSEVDDIAGGVIATPAAAVGVQSSDKVSIDRYEKHSLFNELLSLINLKREVIFNDPVLSSKQFGSNFVLNNSLDISKLRTAATRLMNKFHGSQQQDAHEFLSDFNSSLQDELHHYLTEYVSCIQQCGSSAPIANGSSDDHGGGTSKTDLSFFSPSGVMDFKTPPTTLVKAAAVADGDSSATTATIVAPKVMPECSLLPVSKCFNSSVEVRCVCKSCGFERPARQETYRDFSVELNESQQSGSLQLDQLFTSFFDDEERDLTCERCQVTSAASDSETPTTVDDATTLLDEMTQPMATSASDGSSGKVIISSKLVSLPEILVIHLKRFQYSYESGTYRKINCNVSFPLTLNAENCTVLAAALAEKEEKLAIALSTSAHTTNDSEDTKVANVLASHPEKILLDSTLTDQLLRNVTKLNDEGVVSSCNGIDVSAQYELYSVVRHIGEESLAGHYICDVKKDESSIDSLEDIDARGSHSDFKLNWLRYNDAHVSKITESLVLSEQDTPYIFFYRKVAAAPSV